MQSRLLLAVLFVHVATPVQEVRDDRSMCDSIVE